MIIDVGWYRDEVNTDLEPYVDLANSQQHVVKVKRARKGAELRLQVSVQWDTIRIPYAVLT